MKQELARVEELCLRIPGLTRTEAQQVGRDVAERLAQGVSPRTRVQHLGALDLKVTIPHGTPKAQLAQMIADSILRTWA